MTGEIERMSGFGVFLLTFCTIFTISSTTDNYYPWDESVLLKAHTLTGDFFL